MVLEFTPAATRAIGAAALAPDGSHVVARSEYLSLMSGCRCRWRGRACWLSRERSRRLGPDQTASLQVERSGPRVIDVGAVVHSGARTGAFEVRVGDLDT